MLSPPPPPESPDATLSYSPTQRPGVLSTDPDLSRWFSSEVHPLDANLKSYLQRSFPKVRDVDDVVQESYVRTWRRQVEKPLTSVKGFLFTVARRLAIDTLRREKAAPFSAVSESQTEAVIEEGVSVEDRAHLVTLAQLLIEAVDQLPPRCREVVYLRKFKLLSIRQTAERLGITEHAVDMNLSRGLDRVREYLRERGLTSTMGRES